MTAFDEPSGLASQELQSLAALEAFQRLSQAFLASLEAGEFDYAGASYANRDLADAAQALAAELRSTSACFKMARRTGDEQNATGGPDA